MSKPTEDIKMQPSYPPSGISILIVGAGIGGIMTALECYRKGHTVRIIERSSGPVDTGDFFTVGPSALKILKHWPSLLATNEEIAYDPWVSYHKHTGECVVPPAPIEWDTTGGVVPERIYRHHRPRFYKMLLDQLTAIGIEVEYNHRVVDYYETEDGEKGGVKLASGEKLEADLVVAADGVGTKSHVCVSGKEVRARSTGYSIFRTAYPVEFAAADPEIDERFKLLENGKSCFEMWFGHEFHFAIWRAEDIFSWVWTHKDTGSATESWHDKTPIATVLSLASKVSPPFPPIIAKIIKSTPEDGIVDWKLIWRDPQPIWSSPSGRVLQLGDAAHTFLPTSGNGATQAVEDAVCLATCLLLSSQQKLSIKQAVQIHTKLRFERVSCCQLLGVVNQGTYHNVDWEKIKENPGLLKAKYGRWIWNHDPEVYAEENFSKARKWLESGEAYENVSVPKGYVYKEWNIEQVLKDQEEGRGVELVGDWA
ncbi:hypothetical protein G7Y89_g9071 [Cudoniella acicularis]|uniref:FAD-binding domain-containing protein n=1 Tax=Cudoniella acicularis TaxID=354080 RepID=A0A8H4RFC4_9HELO|nr:hypothetical protein G7Y89_g9071 [Cudoniella acicularis]